VVLARLEHDTDGTHSRLLLGAFRGEHAFDVRETCLGIGVSHDWRLRNAESEAEAAARSLARRTGAHLVLWGEVIGSGERVIRVWFTAQRESTEAKPHEWRIERGLLEPGFQGEFATTIQAIALAALRPVVETGDAERMAELNVSLVPRLRHLAQRPPPGFSAGQRDELRLVLGDALVLAARHGGDRDAASQAVTLYRAMLADTPERDALERAMLRHRIGLALLAGDPSLSPATAAAVLEELGAALTTYGAAGRDLQWWLVFNQLPRPLRTLPGAGDVPLRRAVAMLRGELDRIDPKTQELRWRRTAEETAISLLDLGGMGDRPALHEAEALWRAILPLTPRSEWLRSPAWIKAMLARTLLWIGWEGPDAALQEAATLLDEALPAISPNIDGREGHASDHLAALEALRERGHVAAFDRLVGLARERLRHAAAEHPVALAEARLALSRLLVSGPARGKRGEPREGVVLAEMVLENGAGLGPIPAEVAVPGPLLLARQYVCWGLIHLVFLGEEGLAARTAEACEALRAEIRAIPTNPPWLQDMLDGSELAVIAASIVTTPWATEDHRRHMRAYIAREQAWMDRLRSSGVWLSAIPGNMRVQVAIQYGGREDWIALAEALEQGLAAPEKVPQSERAWLMMLQAGLLARLGAEGDDAATARAMARLNEAEAAVPRRDAPFLWLQIRLEVAEALRLLAPRRGGDTLDRARQAARDVRDALQAFDAPAHMRRAEALLTERPQDQRPVGPLTTAPPAPPTPPPRPRRSPGPGCGWRAGRPPPPPRRSRQAARHSPAAA
jgi:hypothetical protein